jgi:uncharacterized protein YegL
MDHDLDPEPFDADALDLRPFDSEPEDDEAFAAAAFVENPEPRCPCVLVVHASAGLDATALSDLSRALASFRDELLADELAAKRVEVAVLSYPEARCVAPFRAPQDFVAPRLAVDPTVPGASLVDAVELADELVTERKELYRRNGVQYYRPLVFLLTAGGEPDWEVAADRIRDGEAAGAFVFQVIGLGKTDAKRLALLATRDPITLPSLRFRALFQWLGRSLQTLSHSSVEAEFALPTWRPKAA